MKNFLTISTISVVSAFLLVLSGCGGSSDTTDTTTPTTSSGTYIDSVVSGVAYSSDSLSGTTDVNGTFAFVVGRPLLLSLGGVTLREIVSPVANQWVIEDNATVAALLQSLDIDGDPSNGITITPEIVSDSNLTHIPDASELATLVETLSLTYPNIVYVSEADALLHVDETKSVIVREIFARRTLYTTIDDAMGTLESWTFSSDLSSATWQELVGGNDSGSVAIAVDGMTMTIFDNGTESNATLIGGTDDYALISIDGQPEQRLYYNETTAREYFLNYVANNDDSKMIGAWSYAGQSGNDPLNINIVVLNNGEYYFAQGRVGAGGVAGGIEVGTFTVNSDDVVTIGSTPVINTNEGDTAVGSTLTYDPIGDTMTIDGTGIVLTRNQVDAKPWVGAWNFMEPTQTDGVGAILTLDANGTYMVSNVNFADPTIAPEADDPDGFANAFEMGTYTVVPVEGTPYVDITFMIEAARDFNGNYGFNDNADGEPLIETIRFDTTNYPSISVLDGNNQDTGMTISRIEQYNVTVRIP